MNFGATAQDANRTPKVLNLYVFFPPGTFPFRMQRECLSVLVQTADYISSHQFVTVSGAVKGGCIPGETPRGFA